VSVRRAGLFAALGAAVALVAARAPAQRFDPRVPQTFVVGAPGGASPMQRVDPGRTGRTQSALPQGPLKRLWGRTVGTVGGVEHAPLVGPNGEIVVVTSRGEAVWIDAGGAELARVSLGAVGVSPPALTADGTLVVVTAAGQAVGAVRGGLRFHTPLGGDRSIAGRVAPLPLDDGGVVVATGNELTALDSSGGIRASAPIPQSLSTALLAAGGRVVALTTTGAVYTWIPGREPTRAGSFGGPVDGGAALLPDGSLVAVVDHQRVVRLDLARGLAVPRASAPAGTLLLGPPAVQGDKVTVLVEGLAQSWIVTFDGAGAELLRVPIGITPLGLSPDGGAPLLGAVSHAGPLVDGSGTLALLTLDGRVAVVPPGGGLSATVDSPCGRIGTGGRAPAGTVVPAGPGALVVACESGLLSRYGE
jgi:hypothetical protein